MLLNRGKCFGCAKALGRAATVFALCATSHAHSQEGHIALTSESGHYEQSKGQQTSQALQDLLEVLEQETEIATKTRLNIDFVPGMVSVLHGEELSARGIGTVFEALALIPGVELSMTNDGQYQVVVRAVGKTFSSGKVKFLLNGVSLNTTLNATTAVLAIPVTLVERIEVVRGPGSAIYGEFASVGVINVITRKNTNNAFSRYSDHDRYALGAQYAGQINDSVSLNTNFSYQEGNGANVQAGADILASSPNPDLQSVSNSPGPVNDKEKVSVFLLSLGYHKFHLDWQYIERALGDYFGAANALPEKIRVAQRKTLIENLELGNQLQLDESLQSNLKLGWLRFELESSPLALFPPLPGGDFSSHGILGAPNYVEDKYYFGADITYKGLDKHNLLLGVDYSKTKQGETFAQRNYYVNDFGNFVPMEFGRYTGDKNWLAENLSRRVFAVYVQDQYSLSNQWMLTAGLRWDDYSDIRSDFTPRLASVYQLSDKQTLKVQYASSFRPPTFLEQYAKNNAVVGGNTQLTSENLETVDAGYVFNNGAAISRVTLFYYELRHLIAINTTTRHYENIGDIHARGVELEFEKKLRRQITFDGNISFTHADDAGGQQIYGVAELLGNLGLFYELKADTSVNVQYRYIGDRTRQQGDTREALSDYGVVDLTFSKSNWLSKGLTLRAGVRNIFDESVVYPAFLVKAPDGGERPAYAGDYPQPGREITVQLAWQFN